MRAEPQLNKYIRDWLQGELRDRGGSFLPFWVSPDDGNGKIKEPCPSMGHRDQLKEPKILSGKIQVLGLLGP